MKMTVIPKPGCDVKLSEKTVRRMEDVINKCATMELQDMVLCGKRFRLLDRYSVDTAGSHRLYNFYDDDYAPSFSISEAGIAINTRRFKPSAALNGTIAAAVVLAWDNKTTDIQISDADGEYPLDIEDYAGWLSGETTTDVFLRTADPKGRNRKTEEEKASSREYFEKRSAECGVSMQKIEDVLDYDRLFDERELDNYIPFREEGDEKLFRDDAQAMFRLFATHLAKHLRKGREENTKERAAEILSFTEEHYGFIFAFRDFYDEAMEAGEDSAFHAAAWGLLEEMAEDRYFLEEGAIVFSQNGKFKQPWSEMEEYFKRNAARVYLRSYMGLLHNKPLREKILGF